MLKADGRTCDSRIRLEQPDGSMTNRREVRRRTGPRELTGRQVDQRTVRPELVIVYLPSTRISRATTSGKNPCRYEHVSDSLPL